MEGIVYLLGDIGYDEQLQPNGISDIAFISQCEKTLRGGATSLRVEIDSNGGLVDSGNNIASYLKSVQVPVITVNVGKAYSIASKIFLAGGYKKQKPKAKIMIHNNWASGIEGDADKVQAAADQLAATEKQLRKEYVAMTGLAEDVIDGLMKAETYIDAETALNLGLIHEIEQENLIMAKHNKNDNNMSTVSKLVQWAQSLLKEKAMAVKTAEGVSLFIEGAEDGNIEGKVVFIADEAGAPTGDYAPVGTHTLDNGTVITVNEAGVITSVEMLAATKDEEKEAMQAKIAELEKALADKTTELNTLTTEVTTTKNEVAEVNKKFVELAKSIKSEYVAPDNTKQFGRTKTADENKPANPFSRDAIKAREQELKELRNK